MITIRPLRPDDVPALIDLTTVAFAGEYVAQGLTPASLARQIRLVTRGRLLPFRALTRLAGIHWEMWVAESEGRVVGCGGFMGRQQMELGNLMVHPDWRRQGIGQSLLKKRLARLTARGYPLVTTTILADNAASLGNVQKQGFIPFDRYIILEQDLPLPEVSPRLTTRSPRPSDRPAFLRLEQQVISAERLTIQGSSAAAYFPPIFSRWLNRLTGSGQQAAVFFNNSHMVGFSLVRTGAQQTKGFLSRPILPPGLYEWYPAFLHYAADWLSGLGKSSIQIALSANRDLLISSLKADGWTQTQAWLRLVKYLH